VVAVFDVGKTNKKLILFDERYNIIHEESENFNELKDEDGFPCEDLPLLTNWILDKFGKISAHTDYQLKGVNISAYGASLVHLDIHDKPLTPLYNYLKPYPEKLKEQFYNTYGGESLISKQTASPVLGSLNSGMQLYRLKYEQPGIMSRMAWSLHLPQYLAFLLSTIKISEITSIGCHTMLWDYARHAYHRWVVTEGLQVKLPAIYTGDKIVGVQGKSGSLTMGIGLHDSSAALIPYLKIFSEPFLLLSTGTWCISLNPFNHTMLTDYELQHDCLCYLTYEGKPVKAARLFAGKEHEEQIRRLAGHFHKEVEYYKTVQYDGSFKEIFISKDLTGRLHAETAILQNSAFEQKPLHEYKTYEEAYHHLMAGIVEQQVFSTNLVLADSPVKNIYVDGGFAYNEVFMHLLAISFPQMKVYAAKIAQASALGAALVLDEQISKSNLPENFIGLTCYVAKSERVM